MARQPRAKWTEGHADTMLRRIETHLFPDLGKSPIAEIEAPSYSTRCVQLSAELRNGLEDRTKSPTECCRRAAKSSVTPWRPVVQSATHQERYESALKAKEKTRNLAALTEGGLPDFLKKLKAYDGTQQTKLALRLLLLTFVRTGELRSAQWSKFELEKAQWRIPASRMKMRSEHIVPLATQSIEVIRELHKLNDGRAYVFSNQADHEKPMSENTLLYALYRMGYHSRATAHGFRATASTILNEQGFKPDVIERQLAHVERNKIRAAYHRAEYMAERRHMVQHWADFLDERGTVAVRRSSAVGFRPFIEGPSCSR